MLLAGPDDFRPTAGVLLGGLAVARGGRRADEEVDDAVHSTGEVLRERLGGGIAELEGGRGQLEAVCPQPALGIEHAHAHVLFLADLDHHRLLPL